MEVKDYKKESYQSTSLMPVLTSYADESTVLSDLLAHVTSTVAPYIWSF